MGKASTERANVLLACVGMVAITPCGGSPSSPDATAVVDAAPAADAPCGTGCATPDPGAPGPYASHTATVDLAFADGKSATLTLYVPDTAGPLPVVVFLHGFQLTTDLYASYGTHLASWGYVVVMPQMPSGLIGGPTHVQLAGYLGEVLDWVAGPGNATGPLAGKVDATHIGLAGHSMGGKIAMLRATQDARPRAVFGVDPVDAAGSPLPVSATDYPSVTPELMAKVTVPIAMLGETTNATCSGALCQACAPAADNFQQYYTSATGPALQIEITGANHVSFLDNPSCGFTCSACPAGTDTPATSRALTQRYMTAFFNVELRQQAAYRSYLDGADMANDVASGAVTTAHKNGF
ncbi:MAG: hypothetical protein K8W52_04460 [Deltaproteobacteria bacterium]|nr:hypothetical protein [Deltaproteobacteria bacterium]